VSATSDGGNGHSRVETEGADLRRYLLGQMSEAEESRVERAYLGSDDALEALLARQDELIEEYLAGELEPAERDRFERLFLASPQRLERLVFLRALEDRAAPRLRLAPAPGARSWVRAAVGLAVIAVAGLLGVRALGPRPSPVDVPPPPAAGRVVSGSPAGAPPAAPAPQPQAVSLRLLPPALRGGGGAPVLDPGAAGLAVLEAPLDPHDGFTARRGRVVAPDGRDVFVSPWQPNRGETVLRVVVPCGALRDGLHVLVVEARAATGAEPLERYAFRVRRR
jgi:hypothetical protein